MKLQDRDLSGTKLSANERELVSSLLLAMEHLLDIQYPKQNFGQFKAKILGSLAPYFDEKTVEEYDNYLEERFYRRYSIL